jgi:putative ubiquitin-RnfH superfamily antitoxin RatB of RatAB toxin-antitoxin module
MNGAAADDKTCLLVVDAPGAVWTQDIMAPAGATIAELLVIASTRCPYEGVDWENATVGVHGTRRARTHVPAAGERVEVYRPLRADPRELRRQRLADAKRGGSPRPTGPQ